MTETGQVKLSYVMKGNASHDEDLMMSGVDGSKGSKCE